jgi:transcriptional regulator with XRE-family HTH domain
MAKGAGGRPPKKLDHLPSNLAERVMEREFEPGHVFLVEKLAQLGATEPRICEVFGISIQTLSKWRQKNSEFDDALKRGRDFADAEVANSLYKRAIGFSHPAVKIFCDPKTGAREIVDYVEQYAPDTTACIFWLKNRQPGMWRDRIEHTGANGGAIKTETALSVERLPADDRDVLRSILNAALPEDDRETAAKRLQ